MRERWRTVAGEHAEYVDGAEGRLPRLGSALPSWLDLAPLLFGLLWSATLTALGLHLRKLGHSLGGTTR